MHAFVVLGLAFPYLAKRLAWGTSTKMAYFVSSGMWNVNSVTQFILKRSLLEQGEEKLSENWLIQVYLGNGY